MVHEGEFVVELKDLDDMDLLTALVMGEAEGEPILGKIAVAWVVKNRIKDKRWPDMWQEVMLQPKQFSCFNSTLLRADILKHDWRNPVWKECKYAAFGVYTHYIRDVTNGANHYHATWLKPPPRWAEGHDPVITIGGHRFYKL